MALMLLAALGAASDQANAVDFADPTHVEAWLRHPVYGDPSFDAFTRAPGNPVHRGAPPFEWPVNGFLFEDPPTGRWFVYVGLYADKYAMGNGKRMACTVYRSEDRGGSWQHLGPVFPEEPFCFDGVPDPVGHAPDVSVVYDDGRYHMVYDWATEHARWENILEPGNGTNNGIGYAWSDRPEGPFVRSPLPVYRITDHPYYRGKYRRAYAATLVRRKKDWMVLAMMDSGPHFSWALIGMTAAQPEGPYSAPTFLRCVDDAYYHPPLLEFYPAFQYGGYVYAPATSVALNRSFQVLFRVPTENAMNPEAWELYQHGSVWHAEAVPEEYFGIWGQTFSGFVDKSGIFHVMFPSRGPDGWGTINMASRPWRTPHRASGFTLSGHQGPSLALLRRAYGAFQVETELELHGHVSVLWGYDAPLGPDRPAADATLHPLSLTRCYALELAPETWQLTRVDDAGARRVLAEGLLTQANTRAVRIQHDGDGHTAIELDGQPAWTGDLPWARGALGLLAAPHTVANVARFLVSGAPTPARFSYLYTEAILGAGAAKDTWRTVHDPAFRYGIGAESQTPGARAKWNVAGSAFTLWAPKGPKYGVADLYIDGAKAATLDFSAAAPEPSQPLFAQTGLDGTYHAILLQAATGTVPLDTLEVTQ